MNKTLALALVASLAAATTIQSNAQTTTNAPNPVTTNQVTTVSVALTAFVLTSTNNPGTVATTRIDTKSLIAALNGLVTLRTTNTVSDGVTNIVTPMTNSFADASGRLVGQPRLLQLVGPDGQSTLAVRQTFNRTNVVDTDVGAWLSGFIEGAVGTPKTQYEMRALSLNGNRLTFSVFGFATRNTRDVSTPLGKFTGMTTAINAVPAGLGGVGTNKAVFKGTFNASAPTVEKKALPLKGHSSNGFGVANG
jgi:hypothetical protein